MVEDVPRPPRQQRIAESSTSSTSSVFSSSMGPRPVAIGGQHHHRSTGWGGWWGSSSRRTTTTTTSEGRNRPRETRTTHARRGVEEGCYILGHDDEFDEDWMHRDGDIMESDGDGGLRVMRRGSSRGCDAVLYCDSEWEEGDEEVEWNGIDVVETEQHRHDGLRNTSLQHGVGDGGGGGDGAEKERRSPRLEVERNENPSTLGMLRWNKELVERGEEEESRGLNDGRCRRMTRSMRSRRSVEET